MYARSGRAYDECSVQQAALAPATIVQGVRQHHKVDLVNRAAGRCYGADPHLPGSWGGQHRKHNSDVLLEAHCAHKLRLEERRVANAEL